MATFGPDGFTSGSNGQALTDYNANYVECGADGLSVKTLVVKEAAGTTGGDTWNANYISNTGIGNDQYAQAKVITASDDFNYRYVGVMVRVSGAAATWDGYIYYSDYFNGARIGRIDNGVITDLVTGMTRFSDSDVIYLEIIGSTLIAKRNGAQAGTTSDATYASGAPGIAVHTAGVECVDDFEAGDVAAAATTFYTVTELRGSGLSSLPGSSPFYIGPGGSPIIIQ